METLTSIFKLRIVIAIRHRYNTGIEPKRLHARSLPKFQQYQPSALRTWPNLADATIPQQSLVALRPLRKQSLWLSILTLSATRERCEAAGWLLLASTDASTCFEKGATWINSVQSRFLPCFPLMYFTLSSLSKSECQNQREAKNKVTCSVTFRRSTFNI